MDVWTIHALLEVTFEELPTTGLELDPDCIIRPVDAKLQAFANDVLRPLIGIVPCNEITAAPAVNLVERDDHEPMTDDSSRASLNRSISWTQHFLFALWLVKDHSGNLADTHLLQFTGRDHADIVVWAQRPGFLNFMADCSRTSTSFTAEEVNRAVRLFEQLKGLAPTGDWWGAAPRPSGLTFESRLVRTIYFAQAARASPEIAIKLAFQCICFESLFASSADSISHRVSERVALLIGVDAADARDVYAKARSLYKARSNVAHGDPIKTDRLPQLRQTAQHADELLRRAILRILSNVELLASFSKKNAEDLDSYFLGRIFSGPFEDATGSTG